MYHNSWLCPSHSRKSLGLRQWCVKDSGSHVGTAPSGLWTVLQLLAFQDLSVPADDRKGEGNTTSIHLALDFWDSRWHLGSEVAG